MSFLKKAKELFNKKDRLTKRLKSGEYSIEAYKIFQKRRVQVISQVISPRGRATKKEGSYDPFGKPAKSMPQSAQDYFLQSRAIEHYAYDPLKKVCEVGFVGGGVYLLHNFDGNMWRGWINSASKGRYFLYNIRPFYVGGSKSPKPYERIA